MLSHLNTLIGFAAVFAILSLLVTALVQVARKFLKLQSRQLEQTLLRLFGELRDPERFVAAMLTHPSLEGRRGGHLHRILVDPSSPQSDVEAAWRTVLSSARWAAWKPWVRTVALDRQSVKDIGQAVYAQIGPLIDPPLREPEGETESGSYEEVASALRTKDLSGAVPQNRGRLWMMATAAFPEAGGQVPPLKTYVAAFHDEADASTSDKFVWWTRCLTVIIAMAVALAFRVDAVTVWNQMASKDAPLPILAAGAAHPAVPGFLLAVVALSLGAPVWFETLKSAIQLKSAFTKESK